jgi:hypothetical protein
MHFFFCMDCFTYLKVPVRVKCVPVDLRSPIIINDKLAENVEKKAENDNVIETKGKLGLEIGHLADRLLFHF